MTMLVMMLAYLYVFGAVMTTVDIERSCDDWGAMVYPIAMLWPLALLLAVLVLLARRAYWAIDDARRARYVRERCRRLAEDARLSPAVREVFAHARVSVVDDDECSRVMREAPRADDDRAS